MDTNDFRNKSKFFHREPIRPNIWQIIAKVYNEFSLHSTIHGIKYTTQAKTSFGRFLWLSVVSLSIIASAQLAHKFYQRHESASMRTLVKSNHHPSWKFRLPAVTMCHSNIAVVERVDAMINTMNLTLPLDVKIEEFRKSLSNMWIALFPISRYEKDLTIMGRVLAKNNLTLLDLFKLVGPRCEDFIVMCMYEGIENKCNDMIESNVTPHGICCSFNYVRITGKYRSNVTRSPKHSTRYGNKFIASFLIKPYKPEDRVSATMVGDGVRVIIHEVNTHPGPSSLEFIGPNGLETVARLYGRRLSASSDVLRLPTTERDCRDSDAKNLDYRADNCYVRCQERAFMRLCECLPFYASVVEPGQTTCSISQTTCLGRVRTKAFKLTLRDPLCNCLPDCQKSMYSLVTTSAPMNAARFNPSKFYKKATTLANATAIHITYSGQTGMAQRRELVLSWINLMSSLGGVFSLFLGCSFISLIEILYFFSICVIRIWRERPFGTRSRVVSD